jgi:carbon-monoxide dehydrogenase large subunit
LIDRKNPRLFTVESIWEGNGQRFGASACLASVNVSRRTGEVRLDEAVHLLAPGGVLQQDLLEGQMDGCFAQGVGQALLEQAVYDESGQLVTGSFMDYAMPRADDFPKIHFETRNIPCATNPLGVKGAGEAGAIGAPPAVIHALLDALSDYGVTSLNMPATPETLWRLIDEAGA